MNEPDLFEPNEHVFTGTVTSWEQSYGELVTDSGVVVRFITEAHAPMSSGTRITISAKRFRPCYKIEHLTVVG